MTATKPLDDIAKIFLSRESRREWMWQLNEQNDFVYGTDAHCLIKAHKLCFNSNYPAHEKTANFDSLYENYVYNEKAIELSCNEIKSVLLKIEKVYDVINCSECNGDGTVTCDYDHEHECPECGGSGEWENKYAPKVFPKQDDYIQIIDSYIKPYYVDKLVVVADYLGIDTISLVSYGRLKAHIFKVGDVEIILMPITPENTEDWDEKRTHKLV